MQIMEAISLSFDDFDLIIHPFQDSRMNRVIAMIQDPIAIVIKHLGEFDDRPLPEGSG